MKKLIIAIILDILLIGYILLYVLLGVPNLGIKVEHIITVCVVSILLFFSSLVLIKLYISEETSIPYSLYKKGRHYIYDSIPRFEISRRGLFLLKYSSYLGHPYASAYLGNAYLCGYDNLLKEDFKKALRYYKKAAKQYERDEALAYHNGISHIIELLKDPDNRYLSSLKRLACFDCCDDEYPLFNIDIALSTIHMKEEREFFFNALDDFFGDNPILRNMAIDDLNEGAEKHNYISCQVLLAYCYTVDFNVGEDLQKALSLLEKAADSNHLLDDSLERFKKTHTITYEKKDYE